MQAVHSELLSRQQPVSVAWLCRVLGLPRSSAYYQPKQVERKPELDEGLAATVPP